MNIKERILKELNKKEFLDLKFVYSNEALVFALEILNEELEKEKKEFEDFLRIENKKITFDDLQNESILDYYWGLLNHYESVETNKKLRKIIEDFLPSLIDFSNYVSYNKKYYEKLLYVDKNLKLDEEQKRIIFLRIRAFKNRGIDLDEKKQKRLKEINKLLSKLSDKFGNNIIDDEKKFEYLITDFDIIKDLPKEVLDITKEAGKEKGGYLFDSDPSSYGAIMKYCSSRKVRKDFEKANGKIATKGKLDNRKNALEILKLRQEKAKILGYKNYAELSINRKMAESPKQVDDLLKNVFKKSKLKAEKEVKVLEKHFKVKDLKSYDFAYYSRLLKEEKYKINEKDIKKYFEFENCLNYLHRLIEKLYSIEIKKTNIKSYDEDVRVYEIYKKNKLQAYFLLDPFYRKGKSSGCWNCGVRDKEYKGVQKVPIIVNVLDFQKSIKGPTTLYISDVETLFHEFGHAVHTMLYESKYSELSKDGIEWDFVELPSQLMENWVKEKESLEKFAKNVDTGEKISEELIEKLKKSREFNIGNFWVGQCKLGLLDMTLHTIRTPKSPEKLDNVTHKIINKYGMFETKKEYKMYCHFSHIFAGGYAAGYYSYMWAEILEADVFERIKEMGIFSPKAGKKLYDTIIGQGVKKDAKELFFDFMGRDIDDSAFYKRYGF